MTRRHRRLAPRYPRGVRYLDNDMHQRDGIALERNGNLTLVEDAATGEVDWRAPFELEDRE